MWPQDRSEKEVKKQKKLREFKKKASGKYISRWTSKDDLYGKVSIALTKQITSRPMIGWVRANEAAGPEVMFELSRLSKENAELRARIADIDKGGEENAMLENLANVLAHIDFNISYSVYENRYGTQSEVSFVETGILINCLFLFKELAPKISRIVKGEELLRYISEFVQNLFDSE